MSPHNIYLNYAALTARLKSLAEHHPQLLRMESIGQTEQGRDIWLMTLTDFADHAPNERAGVWIDGNTHATELAGCQACLHLIDTLVDGVASEPIAELLRAATFYIVPRISVDGAEHALELNTIVRSTPVEFPGDRPRENFRKRDLDGDNEVLFMRVPNPAGLFKVSREDARLMVTRAPEDLSAASGPYYDIIPEGEFENYDGFTQRFTNPARFDLNRQSPASFTPKEAGAGPLPMYLAEARALANAFVARPNIAVCVTHHTYGGFLLRPSSVEPDSALPAKDLEIYRAMGEFGEKVTGYPAISVYHDFIYNAAEPTSGAWDDWHYYHRGAFSWTTEIWSLPRAAGVKFDKPLTIYQDLGEAALLQILRWCDANLPAGTFMRDWRLFNHPQLGPVEIGGWRTLFSWRNPPPQLLEPELKRLTEFALGLARMVPRVQLRDLRIEKVGDDVFAIRIVVDNAGFLATNVSESAKRLGIHAPPTARLKLGGGQRLVQGKLEMYISHLLGRADFRPWISSVVGVEMSEHRQHVLAWTVQGAGQIEFEASYHGAGVLRRTINLV